MTFEEGSDKQTVNRQLRYPADVKKIAQRPQYRLGPFKKNRWQIIGQRIVRRKIITVKLGMTIDIVYCIEIFATFVIINKATGDQAYRRAA